MKFKFKKQQYQTNAVESVADCFAGQPKNTGIQYRIDPGRVAAGTPQQRESWATKAKVLASSQVAVVEVEFASQRALHQRYGIDAVPTTVVADSQGVVRASFLGRATATDLWAAVAEARDPGSRPSQGCDHDQGAGPG